MEETWSIPVQHGLAGPSEFASVIESYRTFSAKGAGSSFDDLNAPSHHQLQLLIDLPYHTSLSAEEGRFPEFRIFVRVGSIERVEMLVNFEVPLPNNAEGVAALKRLAPAASSLSHMLVVEEKANEWVCVGLAATSPNFSSLGVGREEWHLLFPQKPVGIGIRVDGPGSIRVFTASSATFRLLAGRIINSTPLYYAPAIKALIARINAALTIDSDVTDTVPYRYFPTHMLIEHIVADMQAAGFGGALVFPKVLDSEILDTDKYATVNCGKGLGDSLCAFQAASAACAKAKDVVELRQAVVEWQRVHAAILHTANAVSLMSRVDGCVVLDDHLNVEAFGAKIKVSADGKKGQTVLDIKNPVDETTILKLGTRHQSAFGLCRSIPGSTAIVVSQDGDVRVFGSDKEWVTFFDSLEASSTVRPAW